jgi:hypothetical protein
MAEIKISDLTAKSANLANTDLFVIAESDGAGGFVSKKITGAEISAIAGSNIYLIDGTIRSNRTIDLNGVYLAFQNSGADVLKISAADVISFNNAYSFPTADGTSGNVLKTDGAGSLSFGTASIGNYAQTVQSATVSGTTETSIVGTGVGSLTIPASAFVVGDSFHAKIGGVIDGSVNNDEIIVRIKAGATLLASTGSFILDSTTNNGWECELDFTIAAIGATGSICTNGNFAYTKLVDKKVQGYVFQDVQPIDTTISNTLDITVEFDNTNTDIYSANFVLYKTY